MITQSFNLGLQLSLYQKNNVSSVTNQTQFSTEIDIFLKVNPSKYQMVA